MTPPTPNLCNQQMNISILWSRCRQQFRCSGSHCLVTGKPQSNQASLGLVRDGIAPQLHNDCAANGLRSCDSIVGRQNLCFLGERQPVRRQ